MYSAEGQSGRFVEEMFIRMRDCICKPMGVFSHPVASVTRLTCDGRSSRARCGETRAWRTRSHRCRTRWTLSSPRSLLCALALRPTMEFFHNRVDSFGPTKSKRTKASSSKQPTWPHPASFKATPETLAEAGFYFHPDPDNPDNVACFMCKKNLDGWEPDDDPFSIHYNKCRDSCAWAVVRCQRALDDEGYAFYLFCLLAKVLKTLTALTSPIRRVIRRVRPWRRTV